jgi:hypothetical protein
MKVRATVVFTFQARTLADAGSLLDDVLVRARERDDVDVGAVEVVSPPGEHIVTLPPAPTPAGFARPAPARGGRRRTAR